jgi:hypothetical protein
MNDIYIKLYYDKRGLYFKYNKQKGLKANSIIDFTTMP